MGCFPISNLKKNSAPNSIINSTDLFTKHSNYIKKVDKNYGKEKIQIEIIESIFIEKCKENPLDHYEIINKLREGTFGKVFKVRHKSSKCIRAMEIINKLEICLTKDE